MKLKTKIGIISLGVIVLLVGVVSIYWLVSKRDTPPLKFVGKGATSTLKQAKEKLPKKLEPKLVWQKKFDDEISSEEENLKMQGIIERLGEHQFSTHYDEMVDEFAQKGKSMVPLLINLLKDKRANVRCFASHTLGKIKNKSAIPYLIDTADDENFNVRYVVSMALTDIDIKDNRVHQALKKLLKDEQWEVRSYTVEAIGVEKDNSFVPIIIDILRNDPVDYVRADCATALGRIKDKSAVPALIEVFETLKKEEELWVRTPIIEVLGKIGDKRAIPLLSKCLKDKVIVFRIKAAEAFGKMNIKSGIPILVEALKNKDFYDEDVTIRGISASILGDIGDESVIPALKKLLNDNDEYVQNATKEAIEKIYKRSGG